MKTTKIIVAFMFVVCTFLPAQDEFMPFDLSPRVGGTRALAMGNAFTAVNSGVDALNGNPGGLASLSSAQFIASGRLGFWGGMGYDDEYYQDVDYSYETHFMPTPKLSNVSLAFPMNLSGVEVPLVGAVGYKSFYDVTRNLDVKREGSGSSKTTYKTRGFLNHLTFGVGTVLSEKFTLGATLNLPMMSGYKEMSESSSSGSKSESEEEWKIERGGFVSFGAIAHLTPELSAGFSYIGAHVFKLTDGEWKSKDGAYVQSGDYDDSERWEMPSYYSIGIAYKVSPSLLLTGDYSSRPWETVEVDGQDWDYLEDGNVWALGFEYGTDSFFRGGFSSEKIAALDADEDPIKLTGLHVGAGVISENLRVDIALVYKFATYDAGTSQTQYEFNFKDLSLNASFIYNFDFSLGSN